MFNPRMARSKIFSFTNSKSYLSVFTLLLASAVQLNAQEQVMTNKTATTFKMASFGDSITRGFNANNTIGDHPGNSWSTGHSSGGGIFNPGSVKSHAELIHDITGATVEGVNAARSGATSIDLNRQVESVKSIKLDYATILIGANDLCGHGTSFDVAAFSTRVDNALQKLTERNPKIKILVVSIPDLLRLQQIGSGTSCQTRWDTLGICKPILNSSVTESDKGDFKTRWRSANEELAILSSKYSENVQFNPRVSEYQFEREHLSDLDCFHPNIVGQNILSEEAWISDWWTK